MNIKLIDVDGIMPHLALTNIYSHFKKQGHNIGFNVEDPDEVYISCILKENGPQAKGIAKEFPNSEIFIGGSGVNYKWLPKEMQKIKPDYNLYNGLVCDKCMKLKDYCKCKTKNKKIGNMNFSMGFTTRGCINKCGFCIVPKKEPKFQKWMHPSRFHNEEFDRIMLLDNNWLANKKYFFETSDWIVENKLKLVEHGMDIRLLDKEIAQRLKEIRWLNKLHFAFDNIEDQEAVINGIRLLKNVGINPRTSVLFYVLVGYNTDPYDDVHRCRLLKRLGTTPFIMQYKRTPWTLKIADWCNRPQTFWSCDIIDLNRSD